MAPAADKKKKILIVDDNVAMSFIMKKALEMKDYEVRTAPFFEGADSIIADIPRLIFIDVSLKSQNGCDVARELKSNIATKHIPILLLTAHRNASQLAADCGADGYLLKPFIFLDLWKLSARHTI